MCNRRCEDACTRGSVDSAVAIDAVKKFIAQKDLDAATRYIPPVVPASTSEGFSEKIAIIGAGPAGLSCAFYLVEKGYKPTVFEKNARPGGMLVYGIPSYKLEKDVVDAEIEVIRAMGVDIRCGVEVGRDVTLDQLRAEGYKAFYIAIGCQGGRKAGVPGEDAEGVFTAVDFLHRRQSAPWSSAAATWPSTRPAAPAAAARKRFPCSAWRPRTPCPPTRRKWRRPRPSRCSCTAAGARRKFSPRTAKSPA